MNAKDTQPTPASAQISHGHGTLRLASYQKPDRRIAEGAVEERRADGRRAALGERRTASQRVLRALFGT
jgi:hypothetical protein